MINIQEPKKSSNLIKRSSYKLENWLASSENQEGISGNWLNQDLVDEVEWWHYVDIIIPNEVEFDKSLMFIG